jgi:NAD-dependent oxidoreductase involved in siderophore biosynthesis
MLPQDVNDKLSADLESDQAYRSAAQAWQQCMRAAGHDFPSPQAAIHSIEQLAGQGASMAEVNERQVALATADTTCDGRTGLRRALAQARAAFLRRLPATIVTDLADGYAIRQRAYRIAVTVP